MTNNSRAEAEASIALSPDHLLEDGAAFAPQARAVPLRGPQHFSEHPVTNPVPVTSFSRVEPAQLEPESILNPRSRTMRFAYESAKRAFDLLLGSVLLIVAIPLILIAAAAIRLETPGSPFFIQTRLGRKGKPFRICKLRGMYADARIRFPSYYDYSSKQDLDFCFHHEGDPRVTRAGMFIRKTSIDELPNLWNVVLGDMSLVGPRPEIPEVLALYGEYRQEYLSVKPGVTCLSKCTGRDRLTKRETIDFDIKYIRKRSFSLDLTILWRTFRSVMLRRDVF
jgi:lipopolysaccharide/colanic/teichoic acid biosynthesis glycosyltransferase